MKQFCHFNKQTIFKNRIFEPIFKLLYSQNIVNYFINLSVLGLFRFFYNNSKTWLSKCQGFFFDKAFVCIARWEHPSICNKSHEEILSFFLRQNIQVGVCETMNPPQQHRTYLILCSYVAIVVWFSKTRNIRYLIWLTTNLITRKTIRIER